MSTPLWFGPADRRLFGWVHQPANHTARGTVVICPSLGQEAVFSHYALRATADELAGLGFLVVRFDYLGTGDSADASGSDADVVTTWLDSVDEAIAFAHRHSTAPLSLLGFRAGALLAVEAAARRADVSSLVLWDAPTSGRGFLRELAIRHNVSVGGTGTGSGFAALGLLLSEATRTALAQLSLTHHTALPADTVVFLDRSDAAPRDGFTTRTGYGVDHRPAPDQNDLLSRKALPVQTQRQVVQWLADTYPSADHPVADETPVADLPVESAQLEFTGGRETVVRIGTQQLFGIVTEPAGPPVTSTTVVFVPDSITPHSGLSRIWTQLAREWAAAGVRSLRFDLSGCGDSPVRPGLAPHTIGQLAHLDDTADAIRFASPDDPSDVVVVGLCSGAYLAVEAALDLRPRGVAVINPVFSFITCEDVPHPRRRAIVLTRRFVSALIGKPAGSLAQRLSRSHQAPAFTLDPDFPWQRALEACFWQVYLSDVAPRLPDRLWRLLNRLLTNAPGVDRILAPLHRRGTRVLMIAGELDYPRSTLGARRRLRAMERAGGLRVQHEPTLDHAMMRPGAKDDVARSLTRFVRDVVGGERG